MSNFQVTICDSHNAKVIVINTPSTLENAKSSAGVLERSAVNEKLCRAVIVLNADKEAVYVSAVIDGLIGEVFKMVNVDGVMTKAYSAGDALKIVMNKYKDPVVKGGCDGDCEE